MSKRVLISLVLLLLALGLSATSYAMLQRTIARLGQTLENAVYTDLPVREVHDSVASCAEESMPRLRILILHEDLTTLESALDELPDLLDTPDAYRTACRRCIRALEDLRNGQRLRAENIL